MPDHRFADLAASPTGGRGWFARDQFTIRDDDGLGIPDDSLITDVRHHPDDIWLEVANGAIEGSEAGPPDGRAPQRELVRPSRHADLSAAITDLAGPLKEILEETYGARCVASGITVVRGLGRETGGASMGLTTLDSQRDAGIRLLQADGGDVGALRYLAAIATRAGVEDTRHGGRAAPAVAAIARSLAAVQREYMGRGLHEPDAFTFEWRARWAGWFTRLRTASVAELTACGATLSAAIPPHLSINRPDPAAPDPAAWTRTEYDMRFRVPASYRDTVVAVGWRPYIDAPEPPPSRLALWTLEVDAWVTGWEVLSPTVTPQRIQRRATYSAVSPSKRQTEPRWCGCELDSGSRIRQRRGTSSSITLRASSRA